MQMQRLTYFLVVADALLAGVSLILGHVLRFEGACDMTTIFGPSGVRMVSFVAVVIFSGYFCEMYRWERRTGRLDLAATTAVAMMVSFFMLSVFYYIFPAAMIGRGYLSLSLLIFGAFQFVAHLGFLMLLELPGLANRVLIIGVGPLAEVIETTMTQRPGRNLFAGFVRPVADILSVAEDKVVGDIDNIAELIQREKISRLVVAVTERRGVLPVRELLRCKLGGVDIVDALCFYEEMTGKLLIENIQPSWFLYSNGFRITTFLRFYKRIFDVFFSSVGILLALPAWPIVALMVKLDSPGPILFKQLRVGEREQLFKVYKFRTMRQDAEKDTGAVWAQKDDPRVTRVGGFFRKTRLDELPQLFNVLMGDMSFVGPRPERPEFVEQLNEKIPYYSKRHSMKPGVTGWAQVCYPYGASEEDALEKLRFDLYYIKNYSILLDFLIILETVKVVLFSRGGR
ncbi:TIGR03013 family XrtA/PEP-CTERM system glycosyltransferase [Trichloromonas sp.]|uniref:TIGR03013 family XrtA/PEP-CTERM system glycosyltransferase n=1 Tax=Trichloromonas sp. TaxID=3069249 RepID=UPI003D819D1E